MNMLMYFPISGVNHPKREGAGICSVPSQGAAHLLHRGGEGDEGCVFILKVRDVYL